MHAPPIGQVCSMAALRTVLNEYRYSTGTASISPSPLLASLKGKRYTQALYETSKLINRHLMRYTLYPVDISPLFNRGEQCDAHEFFIALFASLLHKSHVK